MGGRCSRPVARGAPGAAPRGQCQCFDACACAPGCPSHDAGQHATNAGRLIRGVSRGGSHLGEAGEGLVKRATGSYGPPPGASNMGASTPQAFGASTPLAERRQLPQLPWYVLSKRQRHQ